MMFQVRSYADNFTFIDCFGSSTNTAKSSSLSPSRNAFLACLLSFKSGLKYASIKSSEISFDFDFTSVSDVKLSAGL